MKWWEIMLIIQGYRRRNVLQYQLQRIQAWASAFCMGNKEGKLTKEEQADLLADIAAENARIEAERQK